MSWHGIDFELLCWSHGPKFGPNQRDQADALAGLTGYCGERSSTGRFLATFPAPPFYVGGPEDDARVLDALACRGLIRWSRDGRGHYTVELLPGHNPPVTQDQALDQALRTLSRLRPDARIHPKTVRLLLMIAWRYRQRHGQIFQAEELVQAAELDGLPDLHEQLSALDSCEAVLFAPYPVEGCVQIGLLFD